MSSYGRGNIRNLVLLSHSGAGKTSLSEAMLFRSGAISRLGRVDEGTTTSDYEPEEIKRKISINLSLIPCYPWKDAKLNVIDTPGYADFVGEVKAGLRVADGAVVVVCAASGVEVGTERAWRYAEQARLPRLLFINKMDRENADFGRNLGAIKEAFGPRCLPFQLPIGSQSSYQGVVDLVQRKAYIGPKSEAAEVPSALEAEVESLREKLVEALAERDDELIAKYLEGEEIGEEEIYSHLRAATLAGGVVPVLAGSALQNSGTSQLMDAIRDLLPTPGEQGQVLATNPATGQEEALAPEEGTPLAALVFKTSADPYVGKLTYFCIYSGSIASNSQVWNATKKEAERIGQLFVLRGKAQEVVAQLSAGDIGAVAKLAVTSTGDTLSSREHPLILPPIEFPRPIYSVAIRPKSKSDLDKLGSVLPRLTEEDPTLQVRRELDTGETILSGMGDSHLDAVAEKMSRKFGVEVSLDLPRVPYKETITVPVKAEYKHKKQTGGHGQYGHVFLALEPRERGAGFEFAEKVVGGVVPRNYIPAVEKGVVEALQEGIVASYPVVDLRVTIYDGSYHPVDSSDMSFKIAGAMAFKKGMAQGQPVLIEPIMNLRVTVPEGYTGDVIGDLNTKRARVLGMSPQDGFNVIEAQVPQAELLRYAIELRSITQGRGSFTMEFSHYEQVPAHLTQKITAERQAGGKAG